LPRSVWIVLTENLPISAISLAQVGLQVEPNGLERLNREHNTEEQDKSGRGQRQPMINDLAIAMETGHKLTRIDHQNANANKDSRQPDAECNDEQETKANPLHRHRAQQHDESRGTGNDAAADAKRQQFAKRNLLAVDVVMVTVMMMLIPAMRMIMMMMLMRVKSVSPLTASDQESKPHNRYHDSR
jgi:hypothetical protein